MVSFPVPSAWCRQSHLRSCALMPHVRSATAHTAALYLHYTLYIGAALGVAGIASLYWRAVFCLQ